MTKTEAKRRAKAALHGGYYDRGSTIEASCPTCNVRISVPKIMGQTKLADLRWAIANHLHYDCEEAAA